MTTPREHGLRVTDCDCGSTDGKHPLDCNVWPHEQRRRDPLCIASKRRIRWACLRGYVETPRHDITISEARSICRDAGVPLAALYLPDPSWPAMVKAWVRGIWNGAIPNG